MSHGKAFTIIELLVTISIMLLLVAAASIGIDHALKSERDARRIGDIMNLGKMVDASSQINRGVYPGFRSPSCPSSTPPLTESVTRMCPSSMLEANAANASHLDLSIFANQTIPNDGDPFGTATGIPSYLSGYVYHTQYIPTGGSKPSQASACTNQLLAICQGVDYTLEVGLENLHPDIALHTAGDATLGTAIPVQDTTNRYQYVLNGPYCGTTCY